MSKETDELTYKFQVGVALIIVICIYFGIIYIQESNGYTNEDYSNCRIVKNVNKLNPISRGLGEYMCSEISGNCMKLYYENNQCIEARLYNSKN